jgi:HPt (histidine-containing phosphotransfer) domain-containing protein
MAYDPGAIDTALAAAVGDEPALIAELRQAFLDSANASVATMGKARDGASWTDAALRLKSLAASFGAVRLMALASEAAEAPLDPDMLRKLIRAVERI